MTLTLHFQKKPWAKVLALEPYEAALEPYEAGLETIVIPIRAWYTSSDEDGGEIVAHIVRQNRKIGGNWLLRVEYLNSRVTHGPNVDNIWTCQKCGAEAIVERQK